MKDKINWFHHQPAKCGPCCAVDCNKKVCCHQPTAYQLNKYRELSVADSHQRTETEIRTIDNNITLDISKNIKIPPELTPQRTEQERRERINRTHNPAVCKCCDNWNKLCSIEIATAREQTKAECGCSKCK